MVTGKAILGVDDQPASTSSDRGATELKPLDQERGGLPGDPGSLGWEWVEGKKSNGQISVAVHHVITVRSNMYVVYSVKVEDPNDHLGHAIVAKHISDGTIATGPTADHLIGTNGKASVRIAQLGKVVSSVTMHGIYISADTSKGRSVLSIDFMKDETPGVVEEDTIMMTNPDLEVAHIYDGRYGGGGPTGETFGVNPGKVTGIESASTHFMISPEKDGAIKQITVEEVVAFNENHVETIDEKQTK